MSPPLRWNLGGGTESPAGDAPTPVIVPRRHRPARLTLIAALYVAALIAAAWVGYAIGRFSEARRANLGGIANQLAVETVAWRDGDVGLYRTTLDPAAGSDWQSERLQVFAAEAPVNVQIDTLAIALAAPDAADVTVAVQIGDERRVEHRRYRAAGDSWYLSEVSTGPSQP